MKQFLHAILFIRSFRVRMTRVRLAQLHLAPAVSEWSSEPVSWLEAHWIADMSRLPSEHPNHLRALTAVLPVVLAISTKNET
jgi:hypothetical protein